MRDGAQIDFTIGLRRMTDEKRVTILIDGAQKTAMTIDYLEFLSRGLCSHALRRLIDNASSMPAYKKSRDKP